MIEPAPNARALIEHIAKALVEEKDAVFVDEYEDGDETVIELEVAEADLGKVIGRSGRVAQRTVLLPAHPYPQPVERQINDRRSVERE